MCSTMESTGLRPYPLGDPINGSPHSVLVSLPRWEDVIGYEERSPRVLQALRSGYPRFRDTDLLCRLREVLADPAQPQTRRLLTPSRAWALRARAWIGAGSTVDLPGGFTALGIPEGPEQAAQARRAALFWQHCGLAPTSRVCEGELSARGLLEHLHAEERYPGDGAALLSAELASLWGVDPGALVLAQNGMNALASLVEARRMTLPEGRWVQVGWLYLDTMELLEHGAGGPSWRFPVQLTARAHERISALDTEPVAGVLLEVPTNPLLQAPDLEFWRACATRWNAPLVVDSSLAGCWNTADEPHAADVWVNSLTKYAASEGDVMGGVLAFRNASWRERLCEVALQWAIPIPEADAQRLAWEWSRGEALTCASTTAAQEVAAWLRGQPQVSQVYSHAGSAVLSFALEGDRVPAFYDALALPKSPSFGTRRTTLCPYLYLAHYDQVTSAAGRAALAAEGLPPELLRLSVGGEGAAAVISALAAALQATAA